jgi:hypothetical protein
MAIEPPLHSPENRGERKRDLGHVLVLVGYIMIVADILMGAYVFSAVRGEGGQIALIVIVLDAVVAVALIIIGAGMKRKTAARMEDRMR